jgi:hypothetical protein
MSARTSALLLAFAVLIAGAALAQPASVLVEDWSKTPVGHTGIPPGWTKQGWGSPNYDLFKIETDGNARVLHMRSGPSDGSTISKEFKLDIKQYPVVQWRWKAITLPKGGDSRKKATDDQVCQVYVTFPRFPQAVRSRHIGYVWDTTAPAGLYVPSEKTSMVQYYIVRSGPADVGKWITESRNVYEDYKKIYNEEPGEQVGAVSVAIDSNDTSSNAECYVGEILFKKS